MAGYESKESVHQNLVDAGCRPATISEFFKADGNAKEQLLLLRRHRKKLLDKLHTVQREIDCLDYLIAKIEKQDI